jgi:hypothetical protein
VENDDDFNVSNLTEDEVEDIASSIDIETNFFNLLAKTTKLEVLPIPDEDGFIFSKEDIDLIKKECDRQDIKLLYRVSHRTHASILDPDSKLTGLMPNSNPRGFYC